MATDHAQRPPRRAVLRFGTSRRGVPCSARQGRALAGAVVARVLLRDRRYAARGIAWWPLGAVAAVVTLHEPVRSKCPGRGSGVPDGQCRNCRCASWLPGRGVARLASGRAGHRGSGRQAVVRAARDHRALKPKSPARRAYLQSAAMGIVVRVRRPEAPLAIDSRIELFPTQVWDDYVRVTAGSEGWDTIVNRWGVTIAVVTADNAGLHDRLVAAGWTEIYVDADGSVLQPNGLGPSGSGSTASALLESPR